MLLEFETRIYNNLKLDGNPVPLTIDDVLAAEECFLTNAAWGVLPVVRVEKATIGGAKPGILTRQLREKWLLRVARECPASAA